MSISPGLKLSITHFIPLQKSNKKPNTQKRHTANSQMDTLLCDELLQEIFHRLPPPSSAAISLTSTRFLRLLRSSTTFLSLHLSTPSNPTSFLSSHPFLSSLSISADHHGGDTLILAVSASCPNLRHLRFLTSPVSASSLLTLSAACVNLTSCSISISRPFNFNWLGFFTSLKTLSLFFSNSENSEIGGGTGADSVVLDIDLGLESLTLSGIVGGDYGLGYIWRNCKKVRKLQLKSCESLGDYHSFSGFILVNSHNLQELELRSCRSVVDCVLLKLAENCVALTSLLIYDGGSKESLIEFIRRSKCELKRLDFRLPLDLDNSHLMGIAENVYFGGLVSLVLQSCCLVTGEGLRAIGRAVGGTLEELALINCDVVEREPGLLTALGQSLKRLRKLDLSYNDVLMDKELVLMLVSCSGLEDLKLRGCNRLTNVAIGLMVRSCKMLWSVDVKYCSGIDSEGVEFLVLNSPRLKRLEVEKVKIKEGSKRPLSKFLEVV